MNTQEYNHCVDRYSDNLYRFILKNIKDEEKAKDIIQDTYAKLWVKVEEVSAEKVKSYLFSTAYHTMIDLIRREKKRGNMDEIELYAVGHSGQYSDLKEILNEAVNKLPPVQRSVVLLRDYEGYSYKEIAEIVSLNESQVKVYIYRARVFLKKYIGRIETVI